MTFNIRYANRADGDNAWPNRRDMLYQVIRDAHPDVLGLQEALRSQLDDLGEVQMARIIREHRDGLYPSDHFPVTARLRLQP
ncbi:endonuclease/exonuclease/phosphatase family protein [Sorangium sp. So ce302]